MTQDDAHIYCTREQMRDELTSLLQFVLDLLADYGLDDFYLELSTKDPDKYVGSDEVWDEATETLREVAEASGLDLVPDPGGAAFYGPEDLRAGQGRAGPQLADVDDPAGLQHARPVRVGVHRRRRHPPAPGADSPRAVRVDRAVLRRPHRALRRRVPRVAVAGAGGGHPGRRRARGLSGTTLPRELTSRGVRAEVDTSDDRMAKKIVNHTNQKVPFLLLAGDRDVEAGAVSFRFRDRTQLNGVPREDAVQPDHRVDRPTRKRFAHSRSAEAGWRAVTTPDGPA